MRIHELAEGLGYWAAGYETLPESHGASGCLLPSEAMPHLEQLDLADRTGWLLFTEPIGKLTRLESFAAAADLVDPEPDPSLFLADLARSFAGILVTNVATVTPRALCHGLTGGCGTRLMLPHLSEEARVASLRYGWQLSAAFYSALVLEPAPRAMEAPAETIEEIIDEAIACPDEHGIKTTEACLREYTLDPDPIYLVAALTTTRRLYEVGVNLY